MLFLLYQKPYDVQLSTNSENEPNIEMIDVTNYSITQEGVTHIVKATKVLRFSRYDEFFNIDTIRKSKEYFLEKLKADRGKLVGDNLYLKGNIRYKNSDNVKFKSEEVDYNLKTKIVKTDVDFTLENNRTITHGTSLLYKTIEKKIYANNIKSTIEEENRR
jgi:LPS export ABC transporter protein LptC